MYVNSLIALSEVIYTSITILCLSMCCPQIYQFQEAIMHCNGWDSCIYEMLVDIPCYP